MAATIIPINTLSPISAPPADAAIRAVVTLIWPFSSSTKQCALLLADPDFRFRNRKGQVRVRFSGASAEAVALGKLGIGDEVLLELNGATWAESNGGAVRTPGRSVDGELSYAGEVRLQKAGEDWIRSKESRPSRVEENAQTPVAQNGARAGLSRYGTGAFGGAVPIYSSPAFVKRARLSGEGFGNGFDPFTEEYEDLDADKPRKRARVSFGGIGKWKLAGRTASPEAEDRIAPQAQEHTDVDVEMDEVITTVKNPIHTTDSDVPNAVRDGNVAQEPGMAPPALPRLEVSSHAAPGHVEEVPSTPNLRPVPSPTLPLPSPFPNEPQTADSALETSASANLPAAASTSQRSLALSHSLPDTADPEDDSSPTGVHAHNGDIGGTYGEHVANPEYLSDTEEDEALYDEHMRNVRREGLRDEHGNVDESDNGDEDDGQQVDEDDAEEVIEDMGEEPEDSSDEDMDESESDVSFAGEAAVGPNVEATPKASSVVDLDEDGPGEGDPQIAAEGVARQTTSPATPAEMAKAEQTTAHLPSTDGDGSTLPQVQLSRPSTIPPTKFTVPIEAPTSNKRKASPRAIPAPQTPAKFPGALFGLDGTSNTPQSTPQSERDRIMARTYSSLFGFSPAPVQPLAQTPTPYGGTRSVGRVEAANVASQSGSSHKAKAVEESPASAELAAVDDSRDSVSLPPAEPLEFGKPARQDLHLQHTSAAERSGEQHLSQGHDADDGHEGVVEDAHTLPIDDVMMEDTPFTSERQPSGQSEPSSQSAREKNYPAAILEAAIEGDADVNAQTTADQSRNDVVVEPADEYDRHHPPPTGSVVAPLSPQVEVIELESSDEEEEPQALVKETQQPPPDGPPPDVDMTEASQIPESPTDVDSYENKADSTHTETVADVVTPAAEEHEVDPAQDTMERISPETLQTQDARSIRPGGGEQGESFVADQELTADEPPMPTAPPPKSNISFHYFSFQSATSATPSFAAEESKTDVPETATRTEVIELTSSSPVAAADEPRTIGAAFDPAETELQALGVDEQMSESFSPELSATQHVALDDLVAQGEVDADVEQASGIMKDNDRMLDIRVIENDGEHMQGLDLHSKPVEHDERISDAEAFSPQSSDVLHTSLEVPPEAIVIADVDDNEAASSQTSSFNQHRSEHRVETTEYPSYAVLPMSPDDSQTNWETRIPPPVPQLIDTAFPPTPQLTQGDSLLKETEVVVEAAEPAPPQPDPPSRHTRSSVDPIATNTSQSKHITPDPPSRHTRSSAEPTVEMDSQIRDNIQKTPTRRITRRSLTLSQVPGEHVDQQRLEQVEEEDSIAVLSPLQKTPVRKSPRKFSNATAKEAQGMEVEQSPQKKSPSKKSLTARLSNVPDVISAWFSPRRSSRLHPDEGELSAPAQDKSAQVPYRGLSTAMGYYAPLSSLDQRTNSQARADNAVDVIAIVSDSTASPERSKGGPRDYFTCFKIWDPSLGNGSSMLVEIFRPWKATLPSAQIGDVILLRGFIVKSRMREPYLLSSDASGWCVWKYAEHDGVEGHKREKRAVSFSGIKEEIKGPPVELGQEERDRVAELREAWEKLT